MVRVYRSLLYLYPETYRLEFADEMACVFLAAKSEIRPTFPGRVAFYARELLGLFTGAIQTHLRNLFGFQSWLPFRRWNMRPGFRFPRSTVVLMSLILLGVVLAIEKAKTIELSYGAAYAMSGLGTVLDIALMVVLVCIAVAAAWGILFALGRSGIHRLSAVRTPEEHTN
jgi:hypothetical protein